MSRQHRAAQSAGNDTASAEPGSPVGKHTQTGALAATLGTQASRLNESGEHLDPILEGNIGALAGYLPQLGTIAVELQTDPTRAGDRAVEGTRLLGLIGSLISIISLNEEKLRTARAWERVEQLLHDARALVARVAPAISAALHAPHQPPHERGAAAERGEQSHPAPENGPPIGDPARFANDLPRPHVPDRQAFYGIELFLAADQSLIQTASVMVNGQAGPRDAGPYWIHAYVRGPAETLLCFAAYHRQRKQYEWMIGVDQIGAFAANVDLYAGVAQKAYPGSANIPDTMADGADKNAHIPSNLEDESLRGIPVGQQADQSWIDLPGVKDALTSAKGGSSLVGARNAAIRLDEYVKPAQEMAKDLQGKIASGEINHMMARQQAVEGRNQLMRGARERMSPGAATASRFAKEDKGATVEQLVEKKIRAMISESGLPANDVASVRAQQAADSELWARYKLALSEGESAELVYRDAIKNLGASPLVSKEIIASAGRPNSKVSAAAKLGKWGGTALGVLGAGAIAYDVLTAEDGERLIAAAKDLSGFTGGVVGAEIGTAGAAWFASLIPGAGEVVLVVTIVGMIGGAAGGIAGGTIGEMMPQLIGIGVAEEFKALMPSSSMATEGGFAGEHARETAQHSPQAVLLTNRVEGAIWDLDQQIAELEKAIHDAPDRQQLELKQRMRIEALRTRAKLEDIYAQLRTRSPS